MRGFCLGDGRVAGVVEGLGLKKEKSALRLTGGVFFPFAFSWVFLLYCYLEEEEN